MGLFLPDGADRIALIIMVRIDQGFVGQGEQFAEQGVIGIGIVAMLEIGPSRAPDEQGIAGEDPVEHDEGI